jgi:hypothetical protein
LGWPVAANAHMSRIVAERDCSGWAKCMSSSTYKIVYAIGLFLLAACAVTPQPRAPMLTATVASSPMSTETRLARAISERITIEASGELNDYRLVELRAEEDGLRRLAFNDDALGARVELIDALADELSAVMAQRAEIAAGADPEAQGLLQVEAVIRQLTFTINNEVRGLSA